jgi:hypothetical protein
VERRVKSFPWDMGGGREERASSAEDPNAVDERASYADDPNAVDERASYAEDPNAVVETSELGPLKIQMQLLRRAR